MAFSIVGLGTAVPTHCMTQAEALQLSTKIVCRDDRQRRLTRVLFRRSGVTRRRTVLPHEIAYEYAEGTPPGEMCHGPSTRERMRLYSDHAPRLAVAASRAALDEAGVPLRDVTHLVTVSCTGFAAPGVDMELIRQLGLPPTTERIHVGYMGCHGAVNGMRAAHGLAATDSAACVLMCAVECCSLHYRFAWQDDAIVGNALFADGAAALIGRQAVPGDGRWSLRKTGSCVLPDSREAMSWCVGDHGFEMRLAHDVPELIERHLRPWLSAWLDQAGLSLAEIGSFAIHPGGPRIIDSVQAALDLPSEQTAVSREVLDEFGNMSSPTILFILQRLRNRGAGRPCLAIAFGPGLVAEVALFD